MDLSKLSIKPQKRSAATSPRDIFKSLTLRGSIQNIWEPQAEALAEWEKQRAKPDIVVQMNTGGGKTLVGLLIAQSIVNETKGKVLYVCPTNQLVEQAASKAGECGIAVATYMRSHWSNPNIYDSSMGPCITNYAAVFNGKSIFRDQQIQGIVFDDAHVAGNFIRGQFTIRLSPGTPIFNEIAKLYRNHFVRNGQGQQFDDACSGDWRALLFVPSFEVQANVARLRKLLIDDGIQTNDQSFAWAHLKDRLEHCAVFISGSGIEITPTLLPVASLNHFGSHVRRVYLTATVPSQVEFLRTFGVTGDVRIIPGGKSGEAQRLFLFLTDADEDQNRQKALQLTQSVKACIIAPSDRAAGDWCPPATKFDGSKGHAGIQEFAKETTAVKLVLVARYDGIDLPGDACRVVILAGMPVGETLIDRFVDQTLRIERIRTAHTATRIVQAIGRIFRSNTDHGAVIVVDQDLERWLVDPQNLQYIPTLLQQQIKLGIELGQSVDQGKASFGDLLNAVLTGRADWDKLYSDNIGSFETHDQNPEPQPFVELVRGERKAFDLLWKGNYVEAAREYSRVAKEAESTDPRLAAWYRHWEGLAHTLAGDHTAATQAYVRAPNERSELGRPVVKGGVISAAGSLKPSPQAVRIASIWRQKGSRILKDIEQIKHDLVYGSATNSAEEALRVLGTLAGLEASRPEKEAGTGPDVLWRAPEYKGGAAIEAKTNKKNESQYRKKEDIGQFHDHIQFLESNYPKETFYKVIVGKKHPISKDSNPPVELRVIELEQFVQLAEKVKEAYEFIGSVAKSDDVEVCAERAIEVQGLQWPRCIDALESALAIDLKADDPPPTAGID